MRRPDHDVRVTIPIPSPARRARRTCRSPILYEDADLAVIDKPAGMVVHPAAGHASGTWSTPAASRSTASAASAARPAWHRAQARQGHVGCDGRRQARPGARALSRQFQDRTVRKDYIALVWGRPRSRAGVRRAARPRSAGPTEDVGPRGARTAAVDHGQRVASRSDGVSLVDVSIATGRTHQIRVHLAKQDSPSSETRSTAAYGSAAAGDARRRRAPRPAVSARQRGSHSRIRPTNAR